MILSALITHLPFEARRGISRKEAASIIGVSVGTFNNLVKTGQMPGGIRIGRRIVWDKQAVEAAFDMLFGANTRDSDDVFWQRLMK